MTPGLHARERPDHPALVMVGGTQSEGTGRVVTYGELDERSHRLGQCFHARGLRIGDHVAILMENQPAFFEVLWACMRSGLYLTTINRYLTVEEAAYILEDCEAKALITSTAMAAVTEPLAATVPGCEIRLAVGQGIDGAVSGFDDYDAAVSAHPAEPIPDAVRGDIMLYSSGTTGRPKGIKRPLSDESPETPLAILGMLSALFGFGPDAVYLSPAPLYHTAPLGYCMGVQYMGGTVVCMEHFDAAEALAAIEQHHVTHSQWVPTMFVRMLKLPEEVRARHDLSSHRVAIHAAAPCPTSIKHQMFDWWGPIIHEYYGGTEGNGITYVGPDDWLAHPGTVGRAIFGVVHICDDSPGENEGKELDPGDIGIVYFELPQRSFEYHHDAEKTRSASHPEHENWTTLGDVGYLDEEGYLYLTDRKSFMIISGGVNIYPQEIEDCLIVHPKVDDVAVIGVPDEEMGEAVKAVVQVASGATAGPELADELRAFAREHLAGYKVPRTVDFIDELPRLPTGKLYKRVLVDRYR